MSPGERMGVKIIQYYLRTVGNQWDTDGRITRLVYASNMLLFLAGRVPSDECARRLAGLESAIDVLFRRME
jgi:hypothetical protein